VARELDVGGNALENGRVGEFLGDPFSVASIVDARLWSRKIVLMVGVLDVGEEATSLPNELEASPEKISSGAHLGRVDVSLGNHASPEEGCDLEGVDAVVLGFASVDGFHIESVTENEVDAFPCAEVGEPVPGEHALHRDGEVVAEGGDCLQEDLGVRREVPMNEDLSFLVEHADVHVPRVQVDATVVLVGYVVESHQALSFRG
jgi:hypothetical protein